MEGYLKIFFLTLCNAIYDLILSMVSDSGVIWIQALGMF